MKHLQHYAYLAIVALGATMLLLASCEKDEKRNPPQITLLAGDDYTENGTIAEIGDPLRFGIEASGKDANLTNFTVKLLSGGQLKTVLDSGLNSGSFAVNETFYQGVEDTAEWIFTVMDKNRLTVSTSLMVYKDPNSTFGVYNAGHIRGRWYFHRLDGHGL